MAFNYSLLIITNLLNPLIFNRKFSFRTYVCPHKGKNNKNKMRTKRSYKIKIMTKIKKVS